MLRRHLAAAAVAALATFTAVGGGCGGDDPTATPGHSTATATDTTSPTETPTAAGRCFDDVTAVPLPAELAELPLPDRTRVYDIEVQGDNGVILTGVTNLLFVAAKTQMRLGYIEPPFTVVGTDDNELEYGANWTGRSISGRWVVADISPICPGDTEVKILWTSAGGLAD